MKVLQQEYYKTVIEKFCKIYDGFKNAESTTVFIYIIDYLLDRKNYLTLIRNSTYGLPEWFYQGLLF